MDKALVNGIPSEHIDIHNRGLHYGDGLFETIAVIDGTPRLWERHMQRLLGGAQRLNYPPVDTRLLQSEANRLCASRDRAVLKIIITREAEARGYRVGSEANIIRIVACYDWPEYPEEFAERGVAVRICTTRLGSNPGLAGIKHLSRLEQVLARSEWQEHHIPEGLMLDYEGHVIEGTQSNLFIVNNNQLLSPDLSQCGIAGIMRELVIEQAAVLDIEFDVAPLTLQDVMGADEVFICNSLIGIWPVNKIEETKFSIGNMTRRLMKNLRPILYEQVTADA